MKLIVLLATAAGIVLLGLLVLLPHLLDPYYVDLATQILIFAIFAMSLDLLMGYVGLPSLGHSAFFGVAAYGAGIFSLRVSHNLAMGLGIGLGLAVAMAAIFGLMVLRARGPHFLMLTLALAQVVWGIAFKWRGLTGGDDGLTSIARPSLGPFWNLSDPTGYYYFALVISLAAGGLMFLIVRSPFGNSLLGIRESENRMKALGYNVWLHQYVAFILAGFFAGLAGVLSAYHTGFVGPTALNVFTSATVYLMVVLGGAGTLFGPVLGAGVVIVLENLISTYTERWASFMAILYLVVVLFAPTGIYGLAKKNLGKWMRS